MECSELCALWRARHSPRCTGTMQPLRAERAGQAGERVGGGGVWEEEDGVSGGDGRERGGGVREVEGRGGQAVGLTQSPSGTH